MKWKLLLFIILIQEFDRTHCDLYSWTGLGFIWMCFYECAAYLSVDTLQKDYQRESSYDWKKIVLNINMISIFIGVVLFFARIHLPEIINNTLAQWAA